MGSSGFEGDLIVKYDYDSRERHELSISRGDRLRLLDGSKNWWKVLNAAGNVGYIPKNYVERYDQTRCRVLYDYEPRRSDELALQKGEIILIMDKSSDGWWKGQLEDDTNKKGWFPSNYVEIMEQDESIPVPLPISNASLETNFDKNYQDLEEVECLFPFTAENPEELSFKKGEHLEIIEKPENDPEWYYARNSSSMAGLVPRNYLKSLSMHPFKKKSWYYGSLSRDQCDYELCAYGQDGDFLIRDSESNKGDFSISLRNKLRNRHFWVHFDEQSNEYKIGSLSFKTMDELIHFYSRNPIYSDEQTNLYLIKPLSR